MTHDQISVDIAPWLDRHAAETIQKIRECERRGVAPPFWCRDVDHVPSKGTQAYWIWLAMLAASPLAKMEGNES